MTALHLGDMTVQRIVEHEIPVYYPADFFDEATAVAVAPHRQWLEPKAPFTGAHQLKKGKMELAHGGTVFLDEVGDISPGSSKENN